MDLICCEIFFVVLLQLLLKSFCGLSLMPIVREKNFLCSCKVCLEFLGPLTV